MRLQRAEVRDKKMIIKTVYFLARLPTFLSSHIHRDNVDTRIFFSCDALFFA